MLQLKNLSRDFASTSLAFRIHAGSDSDYEVQNAGYIVNIASRGGKIGFAGDGAYGAGKFGLSASPNRYTGNGK